MLLSKGSGLHTLIFWIVESRNNTPKKTDPNDCTRNQAKAHLYAKDIQVRHS